MADPTALAVYGTLRRGGTNASYLDGLPDLGTGWIAGRLREMPRSAGRAYPFPALILGGAGRVLVELRGLPGPEALVPLDVLEAYDPADEPRSQYVRRAVAVTGGAVATAWVYIYNGPAAEMGDEIAGGDWIAHIANSGPPP
jgi:gamma-glutamylcyclotransferase (GGCT)/AIG2-like uncharacterized protein YtfP